MNYCLRNGERMASKCPQSIEAAHGPQHMTKFLPHRANWMHMRVEDLMCQIWCIFHILFPEELYLADIINKQTVHVYEAGKKRKQDVEKNHVVMRLFCFTVVLRV